MLIYAIGLLAQGFFSARILVQWFLSEKAHKVLSPTIFWVLSIIGSYLLCIYGWMRDDFAIVAGQVISYYIYLWNLNLKGVWKGLSWWLKGFLVLTPIVAFCFVLGNFAQFREDFFNNPDVPMWLLIYGSAGQIVFTLRFIYQIFYSAREKESELPPGFWILSLCGSLIIVSYAIVRLDPVLILGQSFGLVAYIRNLMIGRKRHQKENGIDR